MIGRLRDFPPFQAGWAVLPFGAMRSVRSLRRRLRVRRLRLCRIVPFRSMLPIAVAAITAVATVAAAVAPYPNPGIHLAYQDGEVVVGSVDYASMAQGLWLEPGQVITWLDGRYVLAESDQAKREIAKSSEPWVSWRTANRDDALLEEQTYSELIKTARNSGVPWLADPQNNPPPTCTQDDSCSNAFFYLDDSTVGAAGQVCVPTYGTRLVVSTVDVGDVQNGNHGDASSGALCLPALGSPTGDAGYTYISQSDQPFFAGMLTSDGPRQGSVLFGLVILFLGWPVIRRGWAGTALKPYALTLPVATAVPLLVLSVDRYPYLPVVVLGAVLVPLAMIPLAIDFLGRVEGRLRAPVASLTVVLALASALLAVLVPGTPGLIVLRAFLAGCVAFVPGVFAARPFHRSESIAGSGSGLLAWRVLLARCLAAVPGRWTAPLIRRLQPGSTAGSGQTPRALIESVDILLAAMTPGIAAINLTALYGDRTWPLLLWLIVLPIATRVVVLPLGRLATTARLQRDLVVSATEAERMRIAADIHDDALQDLTMLVRRLDAAGDTANAQAAREIAERLRAICGDLRLPVLDDLGVGPALEWLCDRLGSASGEITLDRLDIESRLPADIELAVFRVAQEALSNAVRHGTPPLVVRYRSRADWVELEVDDCGAGLAEGAAELAAQTGHLGLLTMTQRAEAVGARLAIRGRPGGGTRVSFIWERAVAPFGAAVPVPVSA